MRFCQPSTCAKYKSSIGIERQSHTRELRTKTHLLHGHVCSGDVACQRAQQRHCQLRCAHSVATGCVHHHHAVPAKNADELKCWRSTKKERTYKQSVWQKAYQERHNTLKTIIYNVTYLVASFTSMLSMPTPARPMIRIFVAAWMIAGVTWKNTMGGKWSPIALQLKRE